METMLIIEWVVVGQLGLILVLLMVVLLLRFRLLARGRRRQKFLAVWQPILMNAVENPCADVPPLARRDVKHFVDIWIHLHESLLDESKENLNQIARALKIDQAALKLVRHGNVRRRLLAVMALGELREPAAWDTLLELTRDKDVFLSLAGARSLVMIDAERAVRLLVPMLASRDDWPASRVGAILQAAGPEVISEPIARAAITSALAGDDQSNGSGKKQLHALHTARLIRFLNLTYDVSALTAARTIVHSSADPEVTAACLQLLESAEDLPIVRRCLGHDYWPVRVQAAAALARIGEDGDEPRLVPLLSDKQWWVRYRAAQALSRLPSMGQIRMKAIQAEQADPFARDVLAQVIAEAELR